MQYWGQKDSQYPDCLPRALANACQFYGIPCPEPETEAWEDLVDFSKCRHGAAITSAEEIAEFLGLRAIQISARQAVGQLPVVLTVWNPEVGASLHSVLIVGWSDNVATAVNYRSRSGPVVERLPVFFDKGPPKRTDGTDNLDIAWPAMYVPNAPNDNCYLVERA